MIITCASGSLTDLRAQTNTGLLGTVLASMAHINLTKALEPNAGTPRVPRVSTPVWSLRVGALALDDTPGARGLLGQVTQRDELEDLHALRWLSLHLRASGSVEHGTIEFTPGHITLLGAEPNASSDCPLTIGPLVRMEGGDLFANNRVLPGLTIPQPLMLRNFGACFGYAQLGLQLARERVFSVLLHGGFSLFVHQLSMLDDTAIASPRVGTARQRIGPSGRITFVLYL